jgi:hypothetical protein
LQKSINRSAKLERIFRASEHGFKVGAFHAKCDNLEDTLTIVRTEFGKIIAGYSHYKWNDRGRDGHVNDQERQAFLLSFDKGEKYVPQSDQDLICCSPSYGPVFGVGYDLLTGDCNLRNNSYAGFPHTYNREDISKIERSQQSFKGFSGSAVSCRFRVEEHEVFRVLFQ